MGLKNRYYVVQSVPEDYEADTTGISIEDLELDGFPWREPRKEVSARGKFQVLDAPTHAQWLWKQRAQFPREWRCKTLVFEGTLFRIMGDASGQLFTIGIWFDFSTERWRKGFVTFEPYYHNH
ncbi:MAG: hypothetical protein HYT50_01135 [Candidatus Wildermuthbacteria bacterium]|nr:hypothetical protein [Candidatus Wildermuthbacteria bacterium]